MNAKKLALGFGSAFAVSIAVMGVAASVKERGPHNQAEAPNSVAAPATSVLATAVELTTSTQVATTLLPLPDFYEYCRTTYGSLSVVALTTTAFGAQCVTSDGASFDMDVTASCKALLGDTSRAVLVDEASPDGWRCSPPSYRLAGPPDWQLACRTVFGPGSLATKVADDSSGWRCASVRNGLFAVDELAVDMACQQTFGKESFGEKVSELAADVECYLAQG